MTRGARVRMRMRMALAGAAMVASSGTPFAQGWPAKPVRMVVGCAPGGGTDVTARIIVQALSDGLNQRVVIDNRPGANGTIGTGIVAKAPFSSSRSQKSLPVPRQVRFGRSQ